MAWTDEEDAYLLRERAKGGAFWAIARALGKSESTVGQRVWRLSAREALFQPHGPENDD